MKKSTGGLWNSKAFYGLVFGLLIMCCADYALGSPLTYAILYFSDRLDTVNYVRAEADPMLIAKQLYQNWKVADLEALKDGVVDDIEKCESGGDYGTIVFDSNNEASVGGLQWQRKSVIHYVKVFEGRAIGKAEAIKIAIEKESARELAKKVIFTESDGWKNWFLCGKKINAEARVDAIKSLMN